MTQWTSDQLDKVGRAEEAQIASVGSDGKLRKPVTVWGARHGDDLYVRSVRGRSGHWFRGIQERHEGRIRAGRVQQDVTFVDADHGIDDEIDASYGPSTADTPEASSTACLLQRRDLRQPN